MQESVPVTQPMLPTHLKKLSFASRGFLKSPNAILPQCFAINGGCVPSHTLDTMYGVKVKKCFALRRHISFSASLFSKACQGAEILCSRSRWSSVRTYVGTYVRMYIYIHRLHMYVCMHACTCVGIYVSIHVSC